MHQFSPQSKVWVYQADRALTADETLQITHALENFTRQWTAHNHQLKATGEVRNNRFVVLMVDETQTTASGCSIDKSVHFIKEAEKAFGVSFFNRQLIAFTDGEEVKTIHMNELGAAFENGVLTAETPIYNTLVSTKAQLDTQWMVPIGQSWAARFIPTQKTTS